METKSLFSGTISVLEKVLDFRSQRHNVIISNIVNADTPGYKSFDIVMDEEMGRTPSSAPDALHLESTHPAHFSTAGNNSGGIRIKYVQHEKMINKGDKNTVDLDRSMTNLAENNLQYNALAQTIAKKFKMLKSVISGGGT